MAMKTLLQIRQEIADNLGILDTNGVEAFDATTSPSLTRVNQYINDVLRESTSDFPYTNMDRSCYLPFYHTINNVPSAYFSGTTVSGSSTGTVIPYPDASALQAGCVTLPPNYNFSGISFINSSGATSVSVSGYQTTGDWTGVGYMYELPAKVDSIVSIMLPSAGVKMQFMPMYDMNKMIPQGVWTSSGTTPIYYTEHVGMSASGNKVVEFFPSPAASLSGTNFLLYFKNKHVDMTGDSEVQNIYPDQFQDIIINSTLEKVYALVNDPDKSKYFRGIKESRILNLRKWSENQSDSVNRFRDGNYGGNGISTGVDQAVGYLINGYGH